jgi:hypothetical protein
VEPWERIVQIVVDQVEDEPNIEGVFLSGSLVNQHRDLYSDVDLGIASKDSDAAYNAAWALRQPMLQSIGQPLHFIERGIEHWQMVAALYGRSLFPPVGLEVDIVFSPLRYVTEQMPYAPYRVVFDRRGLLAVALDKMGQVKPKSEIQDELLHHLRGVPFMMHDAVKAYERQDFFHWQSQMEGLRSALFSIAAARSGTVVYGSKRAQQNLTDSERAIIEEASATFTKASIHQLVALLIRCLEEIHMEYQLADRVMLLRKAVEELL